LMSWIDQNGGGHQQFVDTNTAKSHAKSWEKEYYPDTDAKYLTVYSYTFNKSALDSVRDQSKDDVVLVNLGLMFATQECLKKYEYGDSPEGLVIDLILRPRIAKDDLAKSEYMDFARPCPNFCNGTRLIQ
jgi:hypothetical protein